MTKSNLRAISQNLLFLFIGQGASGVILFITMAYLARVLGSYNLGVISFAEGVLMFFLGITSLGLDYIGIREIAKTKERTVYFTDRILSIRLLLALLSFILLIIFVFILRKPLITKYVTIIYGISLFSAACFLDWVFQGLEKMQFVAIGSITRALIFALGVIFLISNQEQVITVSIIYSLSWLASSIVLLIFYIRNIGLPHFKKDLTAYKSLLKDSLPIGFSILAGWVIHYFGSTMLFLLKGEQEAGIFNAAFRPIILMVTGLTLYFNAIFPIISKSAVDDIYTLKRVINTSVGVILTVMLPFVVLGNFMAENIIEQIYGRQFITGANVFGMLLWWPVIVTIVIAYGRTLIAFNKQHYITWGALISAGLNIVLNLSLIPFLGSFGVAIAKIGADSIAFLYYYIIIKKVMDIPVFKIMLCPLIATSGMFIFLTQSSGQNILYVVPISLTVYSAILFLMSRIVPSWMRLMVGEHI